MTRGRRLRRLTGLALLACVAATLAPVSPSLADHRLRVSFARARSAALVRQIVAQQHADGGKVTACYRVSSVAVRCGLKTWRVGRWTCHGHINNFFAPRSSNHVSTQSRGVVCR